MATLETTFGLPQRRAELVIEPMPAGLLDEPLDYIFADHFRHRRVCEALKRFASEGMAPAREAEIVVRFLQRELLWHHDDEDEDFFPALRRRVRPEDDLIPVLDRLEQDHRRSEGMVEVIAEALAVPPGLSGISLDSKARATMNAFAAAEHRHLALENGIVLTIARIRLTRGDLARIGEAMGRRRGVQA